MPIFEPFLLDAGESNGAVALRLSLAGFDGPSLGIGTDTSFGGATLTLGVVGEDEGGGEIIIVVPDYGATALYLGAEGGDVSHSFDDGATSLGLSVLGFDSANPSSESVGGATFVLRALGYEFVLPTAYGFLVEQPPYMFGYGGVAFETFESSFVATEVVTFDLTLVFQAVAKLSSDVDWLANLDVTLTSSFVARDVFTFILETAFQDTATFTTDLQSELRAILALSDQLVISGEVEWFADALLTVVSAFVIRDELRAGVDLTSESSLLMTDEFIGKVAGLLELASQLDMADEASSSGVITALFEDTAEFSALPSYNLHAALEFFDTANFAIRFTLPGNEGGTFVGYAMNLRNAGMVKYENYPFSGLAVVGNVPLAIGPEGLYRLEGDTDDGDPIRARVRTGLTDFGTSMLKHTLNSFVAYTSDGKLVLKVTTTDGGRKRERWYELRERTADQPVGGRFDVAKGMVGLFWGYELVNVDGADFELDTVNVWPFAVQRRKSGR